MRLYRKRDGNAGIPPTSGETSKEQFFLVGMSSGNCDESRSTHDGARRRFRSAGAGTSFERCSYKHFAPLERGKAVSSSNMCFPSSSSHDVCVPFHYSGLCSGRFLSLLPEEQNVCRSNVQKSPPWLIAPGEQNVCSSAG